MSLTREDRALLGAAVKNEHFQKVLQLLLNDFKSDFIDRMRSCVRQGDLTGAVGNNAVAMFCEDLPAMLRSCAIQPDRPEPPVQP